MLAQGGNVVGSSHLTIGLPVARFILADEEPGNAVGVEERALGVGKHRGHVSLTVVDLGYEAGLTGPPLALVVVAPADDGGDPGEGGNAVEGQPIEGVIGAAGGFED